MMTLSFDRDVAPLAHLGLTAVAFLAIRQRNRALGQVAIIGFGSMLSGFFLLGWLAVPALYWARRLRSDIVSGGALPTALIIGAVILAARLPWPRPMPSGPTVTAQAHVRHVVMVDKIWVYRNRARGFFHWEQLPQPFDQVELQLSAVGSASPITAMDSVDHGSVDGLGMHDTVTVVAPAGKLAEARIVGGRRTWARAALVRYAASMYLWGAVWTGLSVIVASRFRRPQPALV